MRKKNDYKIGDLVETTIHSAVKAKGEIVSITEGGEKLGFPWKDTTPHYEFRDKKSGVTIVAHPKSLKYAND